MPSRYNKSVRERGSERERERERGTERD
jgi:hypothetical protein